MKKPLILAIFTLSALLTTACSGTPETTNNRPATANTTAANTAVTNTTAANTAAPKTDDEIPASVKAAFSNAGNFTKQHKDLTKDQISHIEKDTNAKITDTDHHSYLAFSTDGGTRKQIGAATVVKANGKDFVIIYDNKDGLPVIKEVRGEGVSGDFLKQFAGKGHDDKFIVGTDLKANGVDEKEAQAIAQAVRVDAATMQTLYGATHSH